VQSNSWRKKDLPRPILAHEEKEDAKRRWQITQACRVKASRDRSGSKANWLKIEQLLQFLRSMEKKQCWAATRSWCAWGVTLHCHPSTAKRNAEHAHTCGLLQLARANNRGDAKNKFAIDWEGINQVLNESGLEYGRTERTSDLSTSRDETHPLVGKHDAHGGVHHARRGVHGASQSLCNSLKSTFTTSSSDAEAATAVCEDLETPRGDAWERGAENEPPIIDQATRDAWCRQIFLLGVQRYEKAIDDAIAAGRDVPGILDHFKLVKVGWEESKRGLFLYRRLTESPKGIDPNDAWPPFDNPRRVEIAIERARRSAQREQPPASNSSAPNSQQSTFNAADKQALARIRAMTPDERESLMLARDPQANATAREWARSGLSSLLLIAPLLASDKPP
jgi:hypothetical protein